MPEKKKAKFWRFGQPRPRKQPLRRVVWHPAQMSFEGKDYELHRDGSVYTRAHKTLLKVGDPRIIAALQAAHDKQYPR